MAGISGQPLLVCYVPGLDERRVEGAHTPFLTRLRREREVVAIRTLPSTELVPTLVSGTLPHEHRIWQVSLRPEFRHQARMRLGDSLPDGLVTTLQCVRHFTDRTFDLPVVPWRRRRRFELHRFKYTRRASSPDSMNEFAGYQTIFGLLGDRSEYIFTKDFKSLPALAQRLPSSGRLLQFLEMYALDLTQHWHLDDERVMQDALTRTDQFLHDLRASCNDRGVRFALLVDHGQELVVGVIPLVQALKQTGVPETEFSYFVELASARFWFHTDRARRVLTEALAGLAHTTLIGWREMHDYQVCFEDDSFGELYAFAEAGRIFFPHDFYQPIGNAVLGLMDRHQRQRVSNPVHRGNHGYLPNCPSEQGWLILDDASLSPRRAGAQLIDIAPTLLSLVGATSPPYMKGVPIFGRA
jgi:hypothetical protein